MSFDPEDDPIVDTLVTAVSAIHNEPTHELEPLAHTIDPALLERLVTDSPDGMTSGEVSFRYEGLSIKVAGDGDIYMEWI